jgi:hypothetical protein
MNVRNYLIAAIMAAAMTIATSAKAADDQFMVYPAEMLTKKCSDVLFTTDMTAKNVAEHWAAGFWTGLDVAAVVTGNNGRIGDNLPAGPGEHGILDPVYAECNVHPDEVMSDTVRRAWRSQGGRVERASTTDSNGNVTANYENGGYTVTGTVYGVPAEFGIDTASSYVTLLRSFQNASAVMVGTQDMELADGSRQSQPIYRMSGICVGKTMCADNIKVVFVDKGMNLIGAEFLQAAHITTTLKDGVMTLSAN